MRFSRGNDSDSGASSVKNQGSNFLQAIEQAFAALGIGSTDSSSSTTSINSTDAAQGAQAALSFMQDLMAALHQAGGGSGSNLPPPPDFGNGHSSSGVDSRSGPAFTKDQLTSMSEEVGSSDSKRSEFMSELAANFDEADTNSDGKIDGKEAIAFGQANSSHSSSSSTLAYQGGASISADIQSLIQQLSSSSSTDSSSSNSSQSDLQNSFQSLLAALGGSNDSGTATLENFLKNLASNLEGAGNSGNVVNTKV
jgi:hypothetical protein